ncbi:hypothetical protein F1D05_10005 [Kribbella qitaiheensis]|uniref:Calcineurin-like phosphoesterase domain-containing protein n=1 Tax=Kribbella qitaiheensis TaxID=1544730 RepID=A0A7G6WW00_9ACTN|nr:hypothetical protein [Kribbella qitaiheensis]QNE18165.1 hypothetical protein F1D05_10005 [Kribbella qitaiheensis]
MTMLQPFGAATRPSLASSPVLGGRVGLIGDAHGDGGFLRGATALLAQRGCTSLVQLGNFGLIWRGTRSESRALDQLNSALTTVGLQLYVVLGTLENYDFIDSLPCDVDGIAWISSHIGLLPRSGVALAGSSGLADPVHAIGWLSGAASRDRRTRIPGRDWWPAELTTDAQARGLLFSPVSPSVVLAHEALATPDLLARLADGSGQDPRDLDYAQTAQREHTDRVLSVLDPERETLIVSGRYHLRHSERSVFRRATADGSTQAVPIRQEILDRERTPGCLAVLDLSGPLPVFEAP